MKTLNEFTITENVQGLLPNLDHDSYVSNNVLRVGEPDANLGEQ